MAEEFLRSLEGFQDELTGLLSKQMFRARYAMTLNQGKTEKTVTAVLFSVTLIFSSEALGPLAATEVLKALGKYINTELRRPWEDSRSEPIQEKSWPSSPTLIFRRLSNW